MEEHEKIGMFFVITKRKEENVNNADFVKFMLKETIKVFATLLKKQTECDDTLFDSKNVFFV